MGFKQLVELYKNDFPVLGGHRGCISENLENTIPSFQKAKNAGVKYIEIDVQLSADEIPVIFHDIELSKKTPLCGLVHDYTLNQLRQAFEINTLEEAAIWCKENEVYLALEIKCDNSRTYMDMEKLSKKIFEAFKKLDLYNMSLVFSIDYKVLDALKKLDSNIDIGVIVPFIPIDPVKFIKSMDAILYLCYISNLNKNTVEELQSHGILVGGSVINNEEDLQKAKLLGVDMIESDCPEHIVSFYKKEKHASIVS